MTAPVGSPLDGVEGLNPAALVWAEGNEPRAVGATATSRGAGVVDVFTAQALDMSAGHVVLDGVADVSADNTFAALAVVSLPSGSAYREILGRVNGLAHFKVGVNSGGRVQVSISSIDGEHAFTVSGQTSITDGEWHVVAVNVEPGGGLYVDRGLRVEILVDGAEDAHGTYSPSLFGGWVSMGMGTPVTVGAASDSSARLGGLVGLAGLFESAVSPEAAAEVVGLVPSAGVRRGFVGWGVPIS